MGDLGDALSFGAYGTALKQAAAMDPGGYAMAEMAIVAGLGFGAILLLLIMVVRQSGTAAAGFALVALFALSMAMLFGSLDFLTRGTRLLIGCLTASALVLFVNAFLHTGRENVLVAGLSAILIGVVVTLGSLSALGMDYASQAKLAMIVASLFALLLLVFALMRPTLGRAFLGLCILVAVASGAMMLDQFASQFETLAMTVAPAAAASASLLLAALAAPFIGADVRMGDHRGAAAEPGPLFQGFDDHRDEHTGHGDPIFAAVDQREQAGFDDATPPVAEPAERGFAQDTGPVFSAPHHPYRDPEPEQPAAGDPVSNYWSAGAAAALDAHPDEYVWDALAEREVRCGDQVLHVFGERDPLQLTPEGFRDRLHPTSLNEFDEHVLGGGDPVSGLFDVQLQTHASSFRFRGRRQVDHDGILMRLDGVFEEAQAAAPPPSYAASAPVHQEPLARSAVPAAVEALSVVRLGDQQATGFDATPKRAPQSADELNALMDGIGAQLAAMIAHNPRGGSFAVIDGQALGARPDALASAVGRAVHDHNLPRGAFLVGFDVSALRDARTLQRATEDLRAAGGGAAFILRDANAKLGKVRPDMVWIDAMDASLERRRRSVVEQLRKKVGAPVLVRDVHDNGEAQAAREQGAMFATGRPFGELEPLPTAAAPNPAAVPAPPQAEPRAGSSRSLRSQGLR